MVFLKPEEVIVCQDGQLSFRDMEIPLIVAKYMSLLYPNKVYYVIKVITDRYRVFADYQRTPIIHHGVVTTFIRGINTGWPLRLTNNLAEQIGELRDHLAYLPIGE